MLCDRLRETQRDSDDPSRFEVALAKAFGELGFSATHKGGLNEPDVLLEVLDRRIVVDAKTTKKGKIGEAYINFDAIERYKESYEADHVAVVAVGFSKGVIRETAKKRDVTLIETDALCEALKNHKIYPYTLQQIYEIIFESEKTVIAPKNINPSTSDVSEKIKMVKKVLYDLNRRREFDPEKAYVVYNWDDPSITKAEIEDALKFLSSPPFNIVRKEDDVYSLTVEYDEIRKAIGILLKALSKEEGTGGRDERTSGPGERKEYVNTFLRHLENPNSLSSFIREDIRAKGTISHSQLIADIKAKGWTGRGGSIDATIKVLRDETDQIQKIGRGRDKKYKWIRK